MLDYSPGRVINQLYDADSGGFLVALSVSCFLVLNSARWAL